METLTAELSRDEANLVLYLVKKERDNAQDHKARAKNDNSSVDEDIVSVSFYDKRLTQCEAILGELRGLLY